MTLTKPCQVHISKTIAKSREKTHFYISCISITGWLVGWLDVVGCGWCWLVGWFDVVGVGWLGLVGDGWLVGWLVGGLALVGWMWLVDCGWCWLVDWLIGWSWSWLWLVVGGVGWL